MKLLQSVDCAQKLTSDMKLLEDENQVLKQRLDASKARYVRGL